MSYSIRPIEIAERYHSEREAHLKVRRFAPTGAGAASREGKLKPMPRLQARSSSMNRHQFHRLRQRR